MPDYARLPYGKPMFSQLSVIRLFNNLVLIFCFSLPFQSGLCQQFLQLGKDFKELERDFDYPGIPVSLSADGRVLAIAEASGLGHVSVYAYDVNTASWSQLGEAIYGEEAGGYFGFSVSLSSDGKVLAIGAPEEGGSGCVRVYDYNASTASWSRLGEDIDGEASGDYFGMSVSLNSDGKVLAISAPYNSGTESGLVRIYRLDPTSAGWLKVGQDIAGESPSDYLGERLSLSSDGSTVAISAPANDGNGDVSGHVRVFRYDANTNSWFQLGGDIDGEAPGDFSGSSLSLSSDGTVVAIGAEYNDGNGNASGHVRVYTFDTIEVEWSQIGDDLDGEASGDRFGNSIALSSDGTVLAIGGYRNGGNGDNAGHVRVYTYDSSSGSWAKLLADIDGEAANFFGASVSINSDGTIVAIGAYGSTNSSQRDVGYVRVANFDTDTDGDGVGDNSDVFPLDSTESLDTDNDGVGNNTDTDDDGDGYADAFEVAIMALQMSPTDSEDIQAFEKLLDDHDIPFVNYQKAAAAEASRTIVNVSARVDLGQGEIVTPGFTVLGEQKKLLIRAVGPKLVDLGVQSPMQNPTMSVYKSRWDGNPPDLLATIDDWKADNGNVAEIVAATSSAGAFPLEPTETFQGRPFMTEDTSSAAVLLTLDVGVYTVQVSSADDGVGEVLVEVYEVTD